MIKSYLRFKLCFFVSILGNLIYFSSIAVPKELGFSPMKVSSQMFFLLLTPNFYPVVWSGIYLQVNDLVGRKKSGIESRSYIITPTML